MPSARMSIEFSDANCCLMVMDGRGAGRRRVLSVEGLASPMPRKSLSGKGEQVSPDEAVVLAGAMVDLTACWSTPVATERGADGKGTRPEVQ